jgi:hypothetical protein
MKLSINLATGVYQDVANESDAMTIATRYQNERMRRVRGCELNDRWICIGTKVIRLDGGYAGFPLTKVIAPVFKYEAAA